MQLSGADPGFLKGGGGVHLRSTRKKGGGVQEGVQLWGLMLKKPTSWPKGGGVRTPWTPPPWIRHWLYRIQRLGLGSVYGASNSGSACESMPHVSVIGLQVTTIHRWISLRIPILMRHYYLRVASNYYIITEAVSYNAVSFISPELYGAPEGMNVNYSIDSTCIIICYCVLVHLRYLLCSLAIHLRSPEKLLRSNEVVILFRSLAIIFRGNETIFEHLPIPLNS